MDTLAAVAELLRALAEPNRLRLLLALRDQEMCITELAERTDIKRLNAWKHLQLLQDQRLVQRRKIGRSCHYSIRNHQVFHLIGIVRSALEDENTRIRALLQTESKRKKSPRRTTA